jgi:hypothetical protein
MFRRTEWFRKNIVDSGNVSLSYDPMAFKSPLGYSVLAGWIMSRIDPHMV